MLKLIPLWCPCCKAPLVKRGQHVKTIKAEFVRTFMVCEKCEVRVVLHVNRVPRSVRAPR